MLESGVVALILLAALLHAAWNALTKSSADPLLAIWLITTVAGLVGGAGVLWVDVPDRAAWPYLAASMAIHLGYMLFLVHAYRFGDLSRIYPIARGLAPLVVAALAAAFVGEWTTPVQTFGLVLCCAAIASLAFADTGLHGVGGGAVAAAAATGVMIGAYTVVDGSGVRLAGNPFSYVAWNFVLDAVPISVAVLVLRRGAIAPFLRSELGRGAAGGVMSAIAYGIVMWSMSLGAMANVASLRETSVVFAALIGARVLGEPLGARRLAAALLAAVGLVILQV